MDDTTSNDNDFSGIGKGSSGPDAHGQAALLLVESLVHGLIARSIISVGDAMEIVTAATEVKQDIADEASEPRSTAEKSLVLLDGMLASLKLDLPADEERPWPPGR